MTTKKKLFAVLVCILVAMMALGCSKEDEFPGDYKLICIDTRDESRRDEDFFNIYEKYGIFYATLTIEKDGNASLKMIGTDEVLTFLYDEKYFIDPESKKKDRYRYENNEISLSGSGILGSGKAVFKKMTPDESEKLKNGYSDEDFQKAEKEAEEVIVKYIESLDIKELSIIERTRISNDEWYYASLAEAAQIASYRSDVEKVLNEGHTYTISFSKNGTVIYMDSKEVSADDPFCIGMEERISNYTNYKVGSKLGGEYRIDVLSD
jgi:hypothetical protein